jgi:glutaminyl-tRNA synthetase
MNFIEEKILERGTDKNLVTRFPPEPNGHLHIGHAKAFILSFGLAEKYGGSTNLRFDDTNPNAESSEYVKSITEDIKWMGYDVDVSHTSDYFDRLINFAVSLIGEGGAYVDFSTSEEIAASKGTTTTPGKDSFYRNQTIESNLTQFNLMLSGEMLPGKTNGVLRAKIDMASPNMLMRDPVIYRCIDTPHHITGTKYKAYPMYDFAHPVSDWIEYITESLCTLEFDAHRPLYNWFIEFLMSCETKDNIKYRRKKTDNFPRQTEFNRLSIDYTVLSKRKIKHMILKGIINGWEDPRLLTLKGLKNRGYTPAIIKKFCETAGWTKHDSLTSYSLLEATAREYLNKKALRVMAITDPIKLVITNYEKINDHIIEMCMIENNPEEMTGNVDVDYRYVKWDKEIWIEREDFRPEANMKYHRLKIGGEVRLKGAYVVKATGYETDEDGNVTIVYATYDSATKSGATIDRKIKGTIHWVPAGDCIPIEIRNYDRLFTNERPDRLDIEDLENHINADSLEIISGYIENNESYWRSSRLPVQFLRKGYYYLSDIDSNTFNRTITLKETWK